jgi:hypothetical protein
MHGNTAKKKLVKARFTVKFKAPKGSFVVLSSHWKVKKQTPKAGSRAKAGTLVVLKVVKIKKKPEAAPKVSSSGPNLPEEFEADLKEQLGGQPFTSYCSISGWPCYVAGFAQSVPDTIVITLPVTDSAASKALGAQAARAAFSLTGNDFPSLQRVVVNFECGTFLAQVQRSAVPLLNQ